MYICISTLILQFSNNSKITLSVLIEHGYNGDARGYTCLTICKTVKLATQDTCK